MVNDTLLTDMIDTLYASDDLADTFSRITGTAVQVLDACDFASVTTVSGGELTTEAPTDQAALTADLLQYQEGEGPCLDAATRERWVLTRMFSRTVGGRSSRRASARNSTSAACSRCDWVCSPRLSATWAA